MGHDGYIPLEDSGVPNALEPVSKSVMVHNWTLWLHEPCGVRDPRYLKEGTKLVVALNWA